MRANGEVRGIVMSEKVFELGLVMAGAVSAGAYTAGVMDFLFEALDEYEAARNSATWGGPRHAVRVPIMTGASAGGMTSAVSALHAFHDLEHVQAGAAPPAPARNRLYSSWVSEISIERLLETTDLTGPRRANGVLSALCSDVLDEIVERAFLLDGGVRTRNWIGRGDDRNLRLRLTLTNVRGVPYSFPIFGADQPERYGMLNHADFYEFIVGPGATSLGATGLDAARLDAPEWALFKTAALATGAFPIGLRPREIHRPNSDWYRSNGCVGYEDAANQCFVNIGPDSGFVEAPYAFVSVDGGTIDNEPLELARRYLAGGTVLHNDPNGDGANKAVVLIAPFPNFVKSPPADPIIKLTHLLPLIGSALIDQARFKPDELQKAADDTVFSRFMISPTREGNGSDEAKTYPIACGAMGGFSGFLHESFRRHDYLLGRRNAQAFLRWNFALPETNPLFAGAAIDRGRWLVRDAGAQTGSIAANADRGLAPKLFAAQVKDKPSVAGFPIIPLTDRLCEPIVIGTADMPRPDLVSLDDLKPRIEGRASAVVATLVDIDLQPYMASMNAFASEALRFGGRQFGAHIATELGVAQVKKALAELQAAFA
ncbi:MAG TPA: patatin-like phospholipase family protein [Roseiarcus sp.]|nr:patatin-like phospholipase family protein [Roseiarcus sp.]